MGAFTVLSSLVGGSNERRTSDSCYTVAYVKESCDQMQFVCSTAEKRFQTSSCEQIFASRACLVRRQTMHALFGNYHIIRDDVRVRCNYKVV